MLWIFSSLLQFMLALRLALSRTRARLRKQKRRNENQQQLHEQLKEVYEQQQELMLELNKLYREQAQAAITDAVTGLPNHRAVMTRMDEEVSRSTRYQSSFAIVFVGLDHFKRVNDTWGYRAGDAILHEAAARLSSNLRQEDFVGRYGGEEFAILLTEADIVAATLTAERLLTALNSQPCFWEREDTREVVSIPITGSFGVAVYQLHGVTREELIESADQAMYQARYGGRNRVCIADVERSTGKIDAQPRAGRKNFQTGEEREMVRIAAGVQALSVAAEARDSGTSVHAHRLVALALATALNLGQSKDDLQLLHLSTVLHDVGKIGIPDAILHKPGPLTDQEWLVMKEHPGIGSRILREIGGSFQQLAEIVIAHHERWDGKGYPNQLAGEAIPLEARILTVVDSYDAMTSRRVYREPLTVEQARAELLRCSGSQFDPRIVEAFIDVLDRQQQELLQGQHGQAQAQIDSLPAHV